MEFNISNIMTSLRNVSYGKLHITLTITKVNIDNNKTLLFWKKTLIAIRSHNLPLASVKVKKQTDQSE